MDEGLVEVEDEALSAFQFRPHRFQKPLCLLERRRNNKRPKPVFRPLHICLIALLDCSRRQHGPDGFVDGMFNHSLFSYMQVIFIFIVVPFLSLYHLLRG